MTNERKVKVEFVKSNRAIDIQPIISAIIQQIKKEGVIINDKSKVR